MCIYIYYVCIIYIYIYYVCIIYIYICIYIILVNMLELSEPFAKKEKKSTHSANEPKLGGLSQNLDLPFGDGRQPPAARPERSDPARSSSGRACSMDRMITGPNVGHDAYKTKGKKSYLCSWRYHFRVMINRLNGDPNDKRGDSKWDIIIARVNGVCFIPTAELVSLGFDLPIAEGLPQVAPTA